MFGISEIFGKKYTFVVNPSDLASVTRHICKNNKRCKVSEYVIDGYYRVEVRSNWSDIECTFALLKNNGYVLDVMNCNMHMFVTKKEQA